MIPAFLTKALLHVSRPVPWMPSAARLMIDGSSLLLDYTGIPGIIVAPASAGNKRPAGYDRSMKARPAMTERRSSATAHEHLGRWDQYVSRIRELLREVLDQQVADSQVLEIMERLGALDEMYRAAVQGPRRSVGGRDDRRYRVETVRGKAFLAEHRSPAQQPFRCPEDIYEAFAEVMSRVDEPASFEKLLRDLRNKSSRTLPDYLPRVCLRFWTSTNPPIVEKVRTRYKPQRRSAFKAEARRAWAQLAEQQE